MSITSMAAFLSGQTGAMAWKEKMAILPQGFIPTTKIGANGCLMMHW